MNLDDKGIVGFQDFSIKSLSVTEELSSIFAWLSQGAEAPVIKKLERISDHANSISKETQMLVEDYKKLFDATGKVMEDVMDELKYQYAGYDQMRKESSAYKAEQIATDTAKKASKERLVFLQSEYDKLDKAILEQVVNNRKIDIVEAVFTFLGNATTATSQAISASDSLQENRNIQLTELQQEMVKLENEQAIQLAHLASYTKRLADRIVEKNSVETAVRSVLVAESSLKNIIEALEDIAVFWTTIKRGIKKFLDYS